MILGADIKRLREVTGAGVMECKHALTEAGGDFEKAVGIVHERGLAKAEKKQVRGAGAGLLHSYIHNERVGVLLDLHAETDFVVRGELFRNLAHEVAMQIAAMNPENIEVLLKQPYIKDDSKTIGDVIKGVMARVGENIKVEKFARYEL